MELKAFVSSHGICVWCFARYRFGTDEKSPKTKKRKCLCGGRIKWGCKPEAVVIKGDNR